MITQAEAIRGLKASIDDYQDEKWYQDEKPPFYGILKQPTRFNIGLNQGTWALRVTKRMRILEWVNRGSNELGDWWGPLGNMTFIPVTTKVDTKAKVALGWKRSYKQLKPYLMGVIKKTKPTHIIFYSHSRGCPITAYAAENLAFYNPGLKIKSIYFAAPRPGNQAFCDIHDSKVDSVMVFINGDVVCAVPPWLAGFRQIKNVKGYWSLGFPPIVYPHTPTNILNCIEKDTKWKQRK
jgi:hypothetical protein